MSIPQQPVPSAGAVDLGSLKGAPTEEQRRATVLTLLQQQGIVCPCGAKMGKGAVELVVIQEGLVPGSHPPQLGLNFGTQTYHSGQCQALEAQLDLLESPEAKSSIRATAIRRKTIDAVEWVNT